MAGGGASVQLMITGEMRSKLQNDLGYSVEEVDVMKPEMAAAVIEKQFARPWGNEPMPEGWKRSAAGSPSSERRGSMQDVSRGVLGIVLFPIHFTKGVVEYCFGTTLGRVATVVGVTVAARAYVENKREKKARAQKRLERKKRRAASQQQAPPQWPSFLKK
ncbi:hypothetical protein CYMTET_17774 [Cymbomonas tetramitiformis]|uniref:Uncharacterized protein n=1 Tax=Cymbomonas tetramitiformis TaxID=36881 RepID=A0AAE0G9W6_9CHLO|nr:hypothetical protein CYMTET_26357 [Cymbomonas tetramitiformis]KAK3274020.1 hypothetical protein CYMTET_17774 [Cymbomonas tetramitiformis]